METWFLIIVTVCLAALLKAFLSLKPKPKLPPGPGGLPLINSVKWLGASSTDLEAYLRTLRAKYGPIVTINLNSRPAIFVFSHDLAHQALVQNGGVFADRPKPGGASKIASSNQHNVSSAGYGPTWRTLRRNLTSQILHPSRLKEYSHARKWVLEILIARLGSAGDSAVKVIDHFQFAMFCLLVLMCFGDKLEESKIREVEEVQKKLLVSFNRFQVLNFLPRLSRILFRKRWEEFFGMRKRQQEVLIPLIRARKKISEEEGETPVTSYVDTLLNLEVQDDDDEGGVKRKLTEDDLISACSEFLSAGTDTTSTALQWIMANLVKNPDIQARLFDEIGRVVGVEAEHVGEEDLPKMPYLKAVVLEGLRRHPPGHFVLPHTVTQEAELGGYVIPKNAVINFTVAEMGWDPKVWEDPLEFKPERFLSAKGSDAAVEFDIAGSREVKMMPFGVGRRICPGLGLAILHLEYFTANLVWNFEWAAAKGHEVDLSEKQEFTIVMKHPLHACISPRRLSSSN